MGVLSLALLNLLGTAWAAELRVGEHAVRAISYNVWGLPSPLTKDPSRFKDIAAIIPRLRADIIGFQETFTSRAKVLAEMPAYPHVAWGNPKRGLRFSSGLLIVSKHPIVEMRNILFKNCRGFDCFARKGAQYARIRVPGVGDIAVYNTHLNAEGGESLRTTQIAQIADLIRDTSQGLPVIVLGDMNYQFGSEPDRALRSWADVVDGHTTFVRANPRLLPLTRDAYTYDYRRNAHIRSTTSKPRKIDFIYLREEPNRQIAIARSGLIFDAPVAGRFLSDHFGLQTDLVITKY